LELGYRIRSLGPPFCFEYQTCTLVAFLILLPWPFCCQFVDWPRKGP
jgi:hypothetical protein